MAMETQVKTVVGLFDDIGDARDAVQDLNKSGVPQDNINLMAHASAEQYSRYFDKDGRYQTTSDEGESTMGTVAGGAGIGAVLGGLGGLLVGVSLIPIPGIGPVLAAGPLAAALTGAGLGAAVGGLIGGLTSLGVSDEHAGYYSESIRRGGTLVVVKTKAGFENKVSSILNSHHPVDVKQRVRDWNRAGWSKYDAKAPAYSTDEVQRERSSYTAATSRSHL